MYRPGSSNAWLVGTEEISQILSLRFCDDRTFVEELVSNYEGNKLTLKNGQVLILMVVEILYNDKLMKFLELSS